MPVTSSIGLVKRRSESTRPESGNRSSDRKKRICSRMPRKKAGSETPMIDTMRTPASTGRPCQRAESMPSARPSGKAMSIAATISSIDAGSRPMISASTGCLVAIEVPQSPCSMSRM